MGNCWPTPIDDHNHCAPKPSTLDHFEEVMEKSKDGKLSGEGGDLAAAAEEVPPTGEIMTPKLMVFSLAELRSATRNFGPNTVVGEGGFGTVFKGWLDEKTYAPAKPGFGISVVVKKTNPDSVQFFKQWQSDVKFLGKISHPNLVKLLGYCWEDQQFLLVYEYMQNGSLESHLFRKGEGPLPWEKRLKIAMGAAQGLAFLHTIEKQVIFTDFKTSSILLDGDFNAKLSDFGLAKLGPPDSCSHVTTRVLGTYGYAAPEYVATGHLYMKSDVYGFGVVLLEILTGLRVLDMNRPNGEHNLVDWATPFLPDKRKLRKIIDPRLESQFPPKATIQTAQLILKCLEADPRKRPSMQEVLDSLKEISALKMKPKESKTAAKDSAGQRNHQSPAHFGSSCANYLYIGFSGHSSRF